MKQIKTKNTIYYYKKIKPSIYNDLDANIYELYDSNMKFINEFGSYGDLRYFIKTGLYL